jgi:Ca2+/H+ antiporter, TMEM165/GDT1 family
VSFERLGYLAVFVSAATPWLEVVVVIPAAIAAGLAPAPVAAVAFVGNLITLVAVIVAGDRLAAWWRRRRGAEEEPSGRTRRARRIMDRWGLPGLALAGPLLIGTHAAGLLAIGLGSRRRSVLGWMLAGLALWTAIVTAGAVAFGLEGLR